MTVYRYIVGKVNGEYYYSGVDSVDIDENDSFFSSFKWDKPNRVDVPDMNKIVFFFREEGWAKSFSEGLSLQYNLEKEFAKLENQNEDK